MTNNIIDKLPFSFLEGISDDDRDSLAKEARYISLTRGEFIPRTDPPTEVFIVQRGIVSLRSRTNSVHEYGRLKAGRSIELKSLFNQLKAWDFAWRADEDARVIALPWAKVKACLEKEKISFEYLKRMTCGVEIQKLRRDLSAFGLNAEDIFEVISKLRFESAAKLMHSKDNGIFFCVVSSGCLHLSIDLDGGQKEFCTFETGDHFVFDRSNKRFTHDIEPNANIWYISETDWKLSATKQVFEYFLSAHHPLFYRDQLEQLEQTEIVRAETFTGDATKRSSIWQDVKTFARWATRQIGIYQRHFVQPDQSWSAASCLVIATKAHGFSMGLNSMRSYFAGTEKTDQLENLARISRRIGFNSKIVKIKSLAFSESEPIIIVLRSCPILLYSVDSTWAHILDPVLGEATKLKTKRFLQNWDGRGLFLKPTAYAKDIADPAVHFHKYLGIVKGSRYTYFLVALAATMTFLFSLTIPMFNQYIFEHVLLEKRWEVAIGIMAAYGISLLMLSTFEWVIKYLEGKISYTMEAKMTSAFMQHLIRLPLVFFDRFQKGDALERFEEAKQLGTFIATELPRAVVNILSVIICGALMYFYHVRLFIAAVSFVPILFLVWRFLATRVHRLKTTVSYLQSRDRNLIVDSFDNVDLIRGNNSFRSERWKWEANSIRINEFLNKLVFSEAIFTSVKDLCEQAAKLWVLLIGVELYRIDQITIGKVVASTFLIERFSVPLWALMQTLYNYSLVKAAAQRLQPIFMTSAEQSKIGGENRGKIVPGDLVLENVSFSYGPHALPILENVNLTIKRGEIVTILGENGSGKSTLAALMNGSRLATSGEIYIGNQNIKKLSPHDLRKTVGVIPQESKLFKGSIFENIAMGDPAATHEKVSEAILGSDAFELIEKLPKGLDTQIGAGGVGLSAGQSQKIILARLIYHDPSVFVLDESMSNLDPISQEQLISRFFTTAKGKTVIVITQHVGLLSRADKVILIQNHSVVALGQHHDLIRQNRKYFEFFSKQLAATA